MLSDGVGGAGSNPPACSGTDLDHRPAFARLLRRIPRAPKATRRRRSRPTAAAMRQSDCSRPWSMTASMRRLPTCALRVFVCFSAPRSLSFMLSAFCATSTSIAISRRLMATNSAGAFRTRRIWWPIFSRPRNSRPRSAGCVGDRKHDVLAASRHAIPTIGALWGYGGADELRAAGAAVLCASPSEVPAAFWALSGARPSRRALAP